MKKLIRRLSRVADSSSTYSLLRSDSSSQPPRRCRIDSFRRRSAAVPEGHVPVYVGEEMERFVVRAEVVNHPAFVRLLRRSAAEYGYEQKGVLRIPCHVITFERVMEALRVGGGDDSVLEDLIGNFSDHEFV